MPAKKNKIKCNYKESDFGRFCVGGHLARFISTTKNHYNYSSIAHDKDTPCPLCNTRSFIVDYKETPFSGNSRQRRIALRKKIKSVRAWAEKRANTNPNGAQHG